jgi:hypothetical protein
MEPKMTICKICQTKFEGRRDKLYCSPRCRRRAELKVRKIKNEIAVQKFLASLSPEEKEVLAMIPPWDF